LFDKRFGPWGGFVLVVIEVGNVSSEDRLDRGASVKLEKTVRIAAMLRVKRNATSSGGRDENTVVKMYASTAKGKTMRASLLGRYLWKSSTKKNWVNEKNARSTGSNHGEKFKP